MKTSCENCIFKRTKEIKYNIDGYDYLKQIQTGCFFNRPSYFKTEVHTNEYDESYFLLDGLCNLCRNEEWLEKCQGSIMRKLYNEARVKVDVLFINRLHDKSEIEQYIKENIENINKNKNTPVSINFTSAVPIDYNWLIKTVEKYSKSKFRVIKPVDPESEYDLLNKCVSKFEGTYYLAFDLDTDYPIESILDKINIEVNEKMTPLLIVNPKNNFDGLFMSRLLHKLIINEMGYNIIEHASKIDKIDKMRKEWEQILL